MQINNKTHIVITGGASGIGLEILKELIKKEAKVSVLDINEPIINLAKRSDTQILTLKCDITNYQCVNESLDSIFKIHGPVDILINSAGIMTNCPIYNITNKINRRHSRELWEKTLNINLYGVFNVSSFVIENMVENRKKGLIINLSSISANGNIGQSAYSAAKAGVESLTKVWAKELSPLGIRSTCIAPGFCSTESTYNCLDDKKIKQWVNKTPLRRLGEMKEIISTIKYIIENDYFNGKIIELDGGLSI